MVMEQLINSGLFTALLAVAVAALIFLKSYITMQTEKLKTEIENEAVLEAIQVAEDSIWTVVMQLANEMVDNIKEASDDGKLTPDEITLIRSTARERALYLMGTEAYKILQLYFNDADAWLYTKIDAYARETKQ